MAVRRRRPQRLRVRNAPDAVQCVLEQAVCRRSRSSAVTSSPAGPPFGGLYLKPPSVGRIVRRRHDDAVGKPRRAAAVVHKDRVRDRRRRRVFVVRRQHHVDAVGRQHLERAGARRLRQRVRVDAEEQRPVDAVALAVVADRLRDRQHVPFVERDVERRAAVSRGAERDALRRHRGIGNLGEVGGDELWRRRPATTAVPACRRGG